MNWLKDNMFWKYEGKKEPDEEVKDSKNVPSIPEPQHTIPNIPNSISNNIQIDDSKFVEILYNVLSEESTKNPNFDLNKFLNLISQFNAPTLSEKDRYFTAFVSAKSLMGVSVKTLLDSSETYIGILDNEKNDFTKGIEVFSEKEIQPLMKRIQEINVEEENARNTIQELNDKLNKLSEEKIKTGLLIQNKESEIISKRACFDSAFKKVQEYVLKIRENINNYLPKE